MTHHYGLTFLQLIRAPFTDVNMVWGIVPLYFALLLNELTSTKANFRTAIQTGFSFLWASAQWAYFYAKWSPATNVSAMAASTRPINLVVTLLVFLVGLVALYCGLRRRYPRYGSFLGRTRFSNYFMITIYPIQAHYLVWSWDRLTAILLFAIPVWLVLHFGLMPFRKSK